MGQRIFWETLPLEKEANRFRLSTRDSLQFALKKDMTTLFHREMRMRTNSSLNFILSWCGLQGSGKSFSMIDTALRYVNYYNPPKIFDVDDCHFTITDLLDDIETCEKGSTKVLDEQVFTSGYGSGTEKQQLSNVETTVRADKLTLFFSDPRKIQHEFFYYFEPWEMGALEPWDFDQKDWITQWEFTKCILYSKFDVAIGFVITGTPQDKDFLAKYEVKKDKFIKDIKHQGGSLRYKLIDRLSSDLMENRAFLEDYVSSMSAKLRIFQCRKALEGRKLASTEWNTLSDNIVFQIFKDPVLVEELKKNSNERVRLGIKKLSR